MRIHIGAFVIGGVLAACGQHFYVTSVEPYVPVEQVEVDDLPEVNPALELDEKEKYCLAKNVYHEAGVESRKGKIAVAQVTVNRLHSGKWGKTICDVVYAKSQFSWTLNKAKRVEQPKGKLWRDSVAAVNAFLAGERVKAIKKSHHYHTTYIDKPKWSSAGKVAAVIGQHIFYVGV